MRDKENYTHLLCCPKCKGDPKKTLDVFIRDVIPNFRDKETRYIDCLCGVRFSPRADTDTYEKIAVLWNARSE